MALPLRAGTAGGQQRQAGTLAICLVEDLGQQSLALCQCLIAASGRRSIDDDQPQFSGLGLTLLPAKVLALPRPPFEQSGKPGHAASRRCTYAPAAATGQFADTRQGIRHLARRADAQGFFAQFGTSRLAPLATGCAGSAPQSPCPPWLGASRPPTSGGAEGAAASGAARRR